MSFFGLDYRSLYRRRRLTIQSSLGRFIMSFASRLSSLFASRGPSISEEFGQIVLERAKRLGISPERVLASLKKELSQEAVPGLADAAESHFPDSRCLDAPELFEAARTEGEALPSERKEHLKRCPVCKHALELAKPNDEMIAVMAQRLAQPPSDAEVRVARRPLNFDPIRERSALREAQLASLQAKVFLQQSEKGPVTESAVEEPLPVSERRPARLAWLFSPAHLTAFGMVLVVVLCYPKLFLNLHLLKEEVRDLPVELQGNIKLWSADADQEGKFAIEVKDNAGNKVFILDAGNNSAAFDPVLKSGSERGKVSGWITFDKSGKMEISVRDVKFDKERGDSQKTFGGFAAPPDP
jgi:hypothetical protein